jgi:hypothetical protein
MNATRMALLPIAAGALLAVVLYFSPGARADVGSQVCNLLAAGWSVAEVAQQLQGGDPRFSRLDAVEAVRDIVALRCGPTIAR